MLACVILLFQGNTQETNMLETKWNVTAIWPLDHRLPVSTPQLENNAVWWHVQQNLPADSVLRHVGMEWNDKALEKTIWNPVPKDLYVDAGCMLARNYSYITLVLYGIALNPPACRRVLWMLLLLLMLRRLPLWDGFLLPSSSSSSSSPFFKFLHHALASTKMRRKQ